MKSYKNKITECQNELNNAINCAPAYYSEERITLALSRLTYFVNKELNEEVNHIHRMYKKSRIDLKA